jgi:ATP-binding cassette subfamily C exporter for protease/lipase
VNDKINPDQTTAQSDAPEGFSAQQKTAEQDQTSTLKGRSTAAYMTDGKKPIDAIIHNCRKSFYFVVIATVIINLMAIVPMLFMMNVMDKVMNSRSVITLISLTAVVLGLYVFWSALEWIRSRMMVRLSLRMDWDLSADVFDASFRRFVGRKNINIQQLLGDITILRQFMTGNGIFTIIDAPFAVVFIIIGGLFHPYLAIFAVAAAIIMVITAYISQKMTTPGLKAANDSSTEASRVANASLAHAEATLALGMMGAVRQRWYNEHHKHLKHQVNASEASGLTGAFSDFFQKAMGSLQMMVGTLLAIEGLITAGMMMAATMLISMAVTPITKLISSWKEVVAARQAYERINALLSDDVRRQSRMQLPPVAGSLVVEKVAAVPPGHNKAVLLDIDFKVAPGQAIAIVGPSAAGKTSLVRLLVGVWKPAKGSVRLDGVEISEWDHDEFGPQIGYVPQEIGFFEGTVAENIARLGEIDPQKVVQATKLIGMHETILSFPKGYDTELGETGFALSGGQRQRLAICRALYGMPKFVVMDEPNANLDEVGESALVQAVAYLKSQGSTVIITTHRPRLIGAVDNLLVLRNGAQVGFGPADDMINAVRNLQVVAQQGGEAKPASEDAVVREGTNDAPIAQAESVEPNESSGSVPQAGRTEETRAPGENK